MIDENQVAQLGWNGKIRKYYEEKGYSYTKDKEKFSLYVKDLHPSSLVKFDFYLPDHNAVIEVNGSQHYYDKGLFGQGLEYIKHHDKIKEDYCFEHSIEEIVIPYWKLDKLDELIINRLNMKI